jgi:UDP-arabinose 4-epimerase
MFRVLVTGGAGFIGSHVCKALAEASFIPVTYDNFSRGNRDAVKFGPLEEGDIADADRLAGVIERHRPIGVIHMAAFAYVRESVLDPLMYYRNNVAGSIGLVEAMRRTGLSAIVFSSTCATYGVARHVPITEDHPCVPLSPYGTSKLVVERVLHDADQAYGIKSVSLRYFNAAGSDPEGEIGEVHDPETHIIPLLLMAATGEIEAFTVFGEDFATTDGTAVRDYIHVCDLAQAHILALNEVLDRGVSDIINLGIGHGYSVREVIRTAERVTGLPIPVATRPRHPADAPALIADGARSRARLRFEPKYPQLEAMIDHAWAFKQKRGSR